MVWVCICPCVCLFVGHDHELCTNGWTDQGAAWAVDSAMPMQSLVWWEPGSSVEGAVFRGWAPPPPPMRLYITVLWPVVINVLLLCTLFQLSDARIEISKLQGQCKEQQELIDRLQADLESTVDEYSTLSYQSRTVWHLPICGLLLTTTLPT